MYKINLREMYASVISQLRRFYGGMTEMPNGDLYMENPGVAEAIFEARVDRYVKEARSATPKTVPDYSSPPSDGAILLRNPRVATAVFLAAIDRQVKEAKLSAPTQTGDTLSPMQLRLDLESRM